MGGLPDLPEQDLSGWNSSPDLPEQDWSGWNGSPDLPEQDWSGWEGVPDLPELEGVPNFSEQDQSILLCKIRNA